MADAEVPVCELFPEQYEFLHHLGNDSDPRSSVPGRRRQPYGLATSNMRQKRGGGIVCGGI